jgi:hypothetical protein
MATVRKHHPKTKSQREEKYLNDLREFQAKLEWEGKEKNLEHLKKMLLDLTVEDRLKLFSHFCPTCGSEQCSGCIE